MKYTRLSLDKDQLEMIVSACYQLRGTAQAAGEYDLYDRASRLCMLFESAIKELREDV